MFQYQKNFFFVQCHTKHKKISFSNIIPILELGSTYVFSKYVQQFKSSNTYQKGTLEIIPDLSEVQIFQFRDFFSFSKPTWMI